MGKEAESPPSKFWVRLVAALERQGLPTTQNGVATWLDMSQGSVARWYHGDGYPETETCAFLAVKGKVSIDWLISGREPDYPVSSDPVLNELVQVWRDLSDGARLSIVVTAKAAAGK